MGMEKKGCRILHVKPRAIVVFCMDPRFREAHNCLIKNELGFAENDFIPIPIAGGAGVLARMKTECMTPSFWAVLGQLRFFIKHYPMEHIVLVTHQDCGKYGTLRDKGLIRPEAKAEQEDLLRAFKILSKIYPKKKISAYYLSIGDNEEILFEKAQSSPAETPQLVCA